MRLHLGLDVSAGGFQNHENKEDNLQNIQKIGLSRALEAWPENLLSSISPLLLSSILQGGVKGEQGIESGG
jgi:hypothetical protein